MENDDLCKLRNLSEEEVIKVLKMRFANKAIYTYSGIILVAMNPFSQQEIYGNNVMDAYNNKMDEVDPHVFAISEKAFYKLSLNTDQTIIVSGESGSGKTMNAKYILLYLIKRLKSEIQPEKVLSSNPVIEAFGNAKTQINDNSSRFGKHLKLIVDKDKISGVEIKTYLLEKSRVTHQQQGERNFHIFYQICAYRKLCIDSDYIKYDFNSEDKNFQDKNREDYKTTKKAFKNLGISNIKEIEDLIVFILYLGTIKFIDKNKKLEIEDNEYLGSICEFLKISEGDFAAMFIKRNIIVKDDFIETFNTKERAIVIRDTLARHLYSCLFNYIIQEININLEGIGDKSISILDIYGFEVFKDNGFDQFCINWANEKIQNEFVKSVFKEQQEIYKNEEIDWKEIEYYNNEGCINLIEKKLGIADLVEEESLSLWGNPNSLGLKIRQYNKESDYLIKTNHEDSIKIKHYAYPVEYNLSTFIYKNREKGNEEILENSCNDFINKINEIYECNKKGGVISFFKESLNSLFKNIKKTNIHYIRCIKPNVHKSENIFDEEYVLNQLKASGIIETIKISNAGYPQEMFHEDFILRYKCINIDKNYCDDQLKWGKTKVFLRNKILNSLETERTKFLENCMSTIKNALYHSISNFSKKDLVSIDTLELSNENLLTDKEDMFIGTLTPFREQKDENTVLEEMENNKELVVGEFLNLRNSNCKANFPIESTDEHMKIEELTTKLKKMERFCKMPCRNCKSLEVKYKMQTEALKEKNKLEFELNNQRRTIAKLEKELEEKELLLKNLTEENKKVKEIETLGSTSSEEMTISFLSPYDVIGCLIDLFLEFSPSFNNSFLGKEECLSFAHAIYQAILKLKTIRNEKDEKELVYIFINELADKLSAFDNNIHKITFILSNVIEFKSILIKNNDCQEISEFIEILFNHLCNLQKSAISKYLPDAIIDYQGLKSFECNDGYFKKIFNRTASIYKFTSILEYYYNMMGYFYLPENFINESINFLLKTVNCLSFNGLIIRKNCLSFNRGAQINNNLNELERFCRDIDYSEGILNLGHIRSVVKLVNYVKAGVKLETLIDECSFLNPLQVNELLSKFNKTEIEMRQKELTMMDGFKMEKFVNEPKLHVPSVTNESEHKFVVPRFLPSKYISSVFSSI